MQSKVISYKIKFQLSIKNHKHMYTLFEKYFYIDQKIAQRLIIS